MIGPLYMSFVRPTLEERDTLKRAVTKHSHDPMKARLLSLLESEDTEYNVGSAEYNDLKACIGKHLLHLQVELHRNPNHKPTKLQVARADAIARKFTPNFS